MPTSARLNRRRQPDDARLHHQPKQPSGQHLPRTSARRRKKLHRNQKLLLRQRKSRRHPSNGPFHGRPHLPPSPRRLLLSLRSRPVALSMADPSRHRIVRGRALLFPGLRVLVRWRPALPSSRRAPSHPLRLEQHPGSLALVAMIAAAAPAATIAHAAEEKASADQSIRKLCRRAFPAR